MKKFILSLIIGVFYISAHSQSLVTENKIWSNVQHQTEYGYDYNSYYIKIKDDTLIANTVYQKVYRSNDSLMNIWTFYGSIRQTDTASIYYIPPNSEVAMLLYDFGVKEGDSIAYDNNSDKYLYIDSIRNIPYGTFNELRNIFYLSTGEGHNSEIWVEGIGSQHGILLFPEEFLVVGEVFNLVCFYQNDSLKFHIIPIHHVSLQVSILKLKKMFQSL